MLNWLNGIWESIYGWTSSAVGTGIATTGIVIKELAVVLIMLGIVLWMYKCTKVFRVGVLSYLVGFILEVLGLLII